MHEIDRDGRVVRLTDISQPTPTETQSTDTENVSYYCILFSCNS